MKHERRDVVALAAVDHHATGARVLAGHTDGEVLEAVAVEVSRGDAVPVAVFGLAAGGLVELDGARQARGAAEEDPHATVADVAPPRRADGRVDVPVAVEIAAGDRVSEALRGHLGDALPVDEAQALALIRDGVFGARRARPAPERVAVHAVAEDGGRRVREGRRAVVHHRREVIETVLSTRRLEREVRRGGPFEEVFEGRARLGHDARHAALVVDDVRVAVAARVLVPEAHRVPDLVNEVALGAPVGDVDLLAPSEVPHVRVASVVGGLDVHVRERERRQVRHLDEAHLRRGRPVRHGREDARATRALQGRVERIEHRVVRPEVARRGAPDAERARVDARALLLRCGQEDVTVVHALTVEGLVAQPRARTPDVEGPDGARASRPRRLVSPTPGGGDVGDGLSSARARHTDHPGQRSDAPRTIMDHAHGLLPAAHHAPTAGMEQRGCRACFEGFLWSCEARAVPKLHDPRRSYPRRTATDSR